MWGFSVSYSRFLLFTPLHHSDKYNSSEEREAHLLSYFLEKWFESLGVDACIIFDSINFFVLSTFCTTFPLHIACESHFRDVHTDRAL